MKLTFTHEEVNFDDMIYEDIFDYVEDLDMYWDDELDKAINPNDDYFEEISKKKGYIYLQDVEPTKILYANIIKRAGTKDYILAMQMSDDRYLLVRVLYNTQVYITKRIDVLRSKISDLEELEDYDEQYMEEKYNILT